MPAKPGLALAICAAYFYEPARTGAVVIDPAGKPGNIVEYRGGRFNIHKSDCLPIEHPIIHWALDGDKAYVGLGDSDAIGARSEQRMSQYDALYAGDELLSISEYEGVMRDALWLSGTDIAAQRALFAKLAGAPPR